MKALKEYIGSLFEPEFRLTGIKTALVVGSALFCINHGAAFLREQMNRERWISAFLTKKRDESPCILCIGMKAIGGFNRLTQLGKNTIDYFHGKSNDHY